MINQLVGIGVAWALAIVGTFVALKIVDVTIGLRVEEEHEIQGLDLSQHGEEGYVLGSFQPTIPLVTEVILLTACSKREPGCNRLTVLALTDQRLITSQLAARRRIAAPDPRSWTEP